MPPAKQSPIRVACSALTKTIFAGRITADGLAFRDGKVDVTSDVLKAVIEFVGTGKTATVFMDGKPTYEIEVRRVTEKHDDPLARV